MKRVLVARAGGIPFDALQPGTEEYLRALAERMPLFVIALRRQRENFLHQLAELGIVNYFEAILSEPPGDGVWQTRADMVASVAAARAGYHDWRY